MPTNEKLPPERKELSSDMTLLSDPLATAHAAYNSFVEEMRGRAYGEGTLNNAWGWFKKGWMARGR